MDCPDPCPFCSGRPIKRGQRLAGAEIGAGAGGIGACLPPAGPREAYLQCSGCMIERIDAKGDAKVMPRGTRVDSPAAFQVRCCCGRGMTARRPSARHATAIARRAACRRSIFPTPVDGGEPIACLPHGGELTLGSPVRWGGNTPRRALWRLGRA